MSEAGERKTSPWVYVAIGCAVPVLMVVVLIGAAAFWVHGIKKHLVDDTPEQRAARVQSVLGAERIPEGYYPTMTLSIPLVMQLAVLSDRPPDFKKPKQEPFDQRGFIYVNAMSGKKGRSFRDYVEGKADASDVLERGNVHLGDHEEIGRGNFPVRDGTAHYVANRGSLAAEGKQMRGLVSFLYFECPGDNRVRMAIWFGPDPNLGKPAGTTPDYAGTPADPAQMSEFVSFFSPCKK